MVDQGITDGRLLRGEESRRAILRRAAEIATVDGLAGLTIGRLAGELDVSKSGVFALFGSKEDLQLAVVAFAKEVFVTSVIEPTMKVAPGIHRLIALCENWIAYSRSRVFPGGCFFAAVNAEFDARPGRIRDALVGAREEWLTLFSRIVTGAVEHADETDTDTDVDQLVFELDALARAANAEALLRGDDSVYDRALLGIHARIRQVNREFVPVSDR